jgi:GH15 family glucan-1,4-alpha-glucosidase
VDDTAGFSRIHGKREFSDSTGKQGMPSSKSPFKEAAVQYDFTLAPGEKRSFRFKMPSVPVAPSNPAATKQVLEADYDKIRARTIAYWKDRLAKADHFSVDAPKVMATLKTSLVNDLVAREASEGDRIYQRVNRIQYNHFWVRDGSFFVRSYDMMGLHDVARETINAFFVWKDGKPVTFFKLGQPQPPDARLDVQEDYWGEVLWAVGAHYRTVKDRELLEQVYSLLGKHIDEFVAMCKADPKGLWPKAGPYDAEVLKNGHYTGHSFWALMGLRYAVYLAKEMGREDDATKWQKVHDDYAANFLKQLREIAAQSEGFIPPGMDNVAEGNDWDNNSAGLYPFEALAKDDPLARQTLNTIRDYNYQEGIITYGPNAWGTKQRRRKDGHPLAPHGMVHLYLTFSVSESNTILGEQRKVIEDLYSILAHTGSTSSGFEFIRTPWTREPYGNFAPHGWFHSCYMAQIRNLLVREEGTEVHLASALAPLWVRAGKQVKVTGAPTFFGSVSYTLDCRQDGGTVTLDNHWKEKGGPSAVVLHLPTWFLKDVSATVDGKPVALVGDAITLAPDVTKVDLRWTRGEEPNLSYEEAVRLFLEKFYRKTADADRCFLFPVAGTGGK